MNLESPKVTVNNSSEYIYQNLCNVKNFEKLMPENIAKFEVVSEDTFVFGLNGMPEITLKMKEQIPTNKVVLGAASNKLPFTLTINIDSISETSSSIMLNFEGSFNPMMAMMVKGPISKFLETLVTNMIKL